MKKLEKVLNVLVIAIVLACICTNVFAVIDMNQVVPANNTNADDTILSIGKTILAIVTNVGMILAVIIVAVLGVKYMMGSTEEKAEYKKSMIPYVVGAVHTNLILGNTSIKKSKNTGIILPI